MKHSCILCRFNTNSASAYNKHLTTKKHITITKPSIVIQPEVEHEPTASELVFVEPESIVVKMQYEIIEGEIVLHMHLKSRDGKLSQYEVYTAFLTGFTKLDELREELYIQPEKMDNIMLYCDQKVNSFTISPEHRLAFCVEVAVPI